MAKDVTAGLIRAIHAGKRALGLDDETYRGLLRDVTGRESCRELSARELKVVLYHLRQAGFVQRPREQSPQEKKIRALWLTLATAGKVRDRSFRAMAGYMRRMLHKDPQGASVSELALVIESLKAWCRRAEVEYED